jgi:pseudouridine-5'-phosphate glycosidase
VAALIAARRRLALNAATLVTVPAPEEACLSEEEAEEAAAQANREADVAGIHGPAATPWLLRRVVELTDGRSLVANSALLRNNGQVAAQIAAALSEKF